jgi:hypothetical protein
MDREVVQGRGVFENKEINTGGALDVTLNFKSSGTDTTTLKYFDLETYAMAVEIIPSAAITILSINGKVFEDPKIISTNGATITGRIRTMELRATAATNIKVFTKG